MHPHFHTKQTIGCEEVMNALDECHAKGFLYKAVGMCNGIKRDVTRCLRAQRIERTKEHHEKAAEKRARIRAAWKEIDENS